MQNRKRCKITQYLLNLLHISPSIIVQIYTFAIVTVQICMVIVAMYILILLIFFLTFTLISLSLSLSPISHLCSHWTQSFRQSWANHQPPPTPPNHYQHHCNPALPTSTTTTHFNDWKSKHNHRKSISNSTQNQSKPKTNQNQTKPPKNPLEKPKTNQNQTIGVAVIIVGSTVVIFAAVFVGSPRLHVWVCGFGIWER